ncbi:MAG: hypothetical protein JWO36_4348 [Myxococcales bacterium]|nr:hypothetical protein [Myxococcales bacterium]
MRGVVALIALAGCNQVFGLHATQESPASDAQFFDAPIDAPFRCPPAGTTPRFSTAPHQVLFRLCTRYVISADANLAMAMCDGNEVAQGPVEGRLTAVSDLTSTDTNVQRSIPQLSPEGDFVFVHEYVFAQSKASFVRYRHAAGDHWTRDGVLVMPAVVTGPLIEISTPTRGPVRRVIVRDNTANLYELIDDGSNTLQMHATYTPADLGVFNAQSAMLSADGMRLVLYGTKPDGNGNVIQSVWYTDRPTIADRFRPVDRMLDVPVITDPFLSEDCARLYFSGIGSIWYVQQL